MKVPIIKGKKVVLRPLSLKDAKNFCEWLKDSEVTKFLDQYYNTPPTLRGERKWITSVKKDRQKAAFSIISTDNEHVGIVSLDKINKNNKHAVFGIFIGNKKYWGQGIGTEATRLILQYGFKSLKLHRIHLTVYDFNIRGFKAYKSVGFKYEGKMRKHVFRNGYFYDVFMMGILRNEFLQKTKKKS